ncbi:MAG: 3-hydroxyacyl-ACP dehydratase FabZ [Nitrospinota bacterium]|jgi:beta-hydroxyacyl-ACP dehydratase FabZ|nr:3-hydroxyacyl-ACP dehydratase FabZ [Nitrospinota bacterium]|tara:strand:+ start:39 stop:470 length:432 start_codon:yes stop_codon:yes gene_type:complete
MIDINQIKKYIPHRYPFLLVDKIIEMEKGKSVIGIKNVSTNEPFFEGHFPQFPVMPGVLIIEGMAQTACVFAAIELGKGSDSIAFFMGIDKAKFRKPVVPGDQLRFELKVIKQRNSIYRFRGNAFVEGKVVAEAEIMAMLESK